MAKITTEMRAAPVWKQGAQGDEVRTLQNLLATWGFNPGKIDGAFGPATATALRAWQEYMGLDVTGEAAGHIVAALQSKTLYDSVKVHGTHAPGNPIPDSFSMGKPTLDSTAPASLAPPPPPPPPGQAPRGATPPGGGGGGNVTVVHQAPAAPGPPVDPNPKTDAEADTFIRQKYGSYAWMLDDPAFNEVRDVMRDAAKKGWDEQAFIASAKNTTWFKTHDSNAREWEVTKRSDPPTAAATLKKNKEEVLRLASALGVDLSPADADRIAEEGAAQDWSIGQPNWGWAVASAAEYKADFGGEIGAFETNIKANARDYLMPISDEDAWNMAQKKAKGEITDDGIIQHFKEQATGLLPSLKKYIEEGQTPRQLLGGHINQIAKLLEISPDQVDFLGDPRMQSVISHTDEKTGEPRIKNLTETSSYVKGLDEYWKTSNAQNESAQYMQVLKQTFGMG